MHHHSNPASHADTAAPAHAPASRWLALGLLCLAQFMLILDVTVINVALPELSAEIGLAARDAGWAITAYAVPFAGLMLLGGRSADLFGARRTFLAGLVVFTLGSLWAGFAADATSLLAARVAQGMAAAFLSPSALAMVTHLFHGHDRHRALAVWGAIGGTGAAVGVLLGGLLTAGPGWRWIFFVNVPVGAMVALGLPFLVPAIRGIADGRLDLMGALLATLATASLIYGVAASGSGGPLWMWALAAAVAIYAVFVLVEMSSAKPLVDLRLLGRRPIQAGALLMLVGTGLLVGAFFLLSFLLQGRLGWSALDTGLGFLPVALTTIVGAHLAGHAIGHLGARTVAVAGLAVAAASLGLGTLVLDSPLLLIGAVALAALGLGPAFVAATTTAMASAGPHEAGIVSGLVNTFHEVGGAIGVAVLASVAAASLADPTELSGFGSALALAAGAAAAGLLIAALVVPPGRPAPGAPRFVH